MLRRARCYHLRMATSPKETLQLLKDRFATIHDLGSSAAVLAWDRQTYMPEGAVEARAEQLATLGRMAHELTVDDETGRLLDALGDEEDPDSDDGATVRLARREYEQSARLPSRLVSDLTRATSLAESGLGPGAGGVRLEHIRPAPGEDSASPARSRRGPRVRGSPLRRHAGHLRARRDKGSSGADVRGPQERQSYR